jgi:hypothetical protein
VVEPGVAEVVPELVRGHLDANIAHQAKVMCRASSESRHQTRHEHHGLLVKAAASDPSA